MKKNETDSPINLAALFLLPLFFLFSFQLTALDPDKPLHYYQLDEWQLSRGIPHNWISAIAQTADGLANVNVPLAAEKNAFAWEIQTNQTGRSGNTITCTYNPIHQIQPTGRKNKKNCPGRFLFSNPINPGSDTFFIRFRVRARHH
jgi:hypothetical protein